MKIPLHRDDALRLDRALAFGPPAWHELQQLAHLAREHTPDADGYPHGGMQDGSRGSDATSTTERAALTPSDPGTEALKRAVHETLIAAKHLAFARSALLAYLRPVQLKQGRTNDTVTCPACGELALPRVISGYCPKCYEAWRSGGFGDRTTFENGRITRAQRAEAS